MLLHFIPSNHHSAVVAVQEKRVQQRKMEFALICALMNKTVFVVVVVAVVCVLGIC